MKRSLNLFSFWLFIILSTTTMLFNACDKGNEPDEPNLPDVPEQKPITPKDGDAFVVMDSITVSQYLQSISEDGTLTFSNLPADKIPGTGNIICSGITKNAPYGFFYRVNKVSAKNGNTIIETTEASLEEAIENCNVSKTFSLDEHIIGIDDQEGNPIKISGLRSSQAGKIPVDISLKMAEGTISVKGSLSLENDLDFDISIENYSLNYMRMIYKMTSDLQVTLGGELKGAIPLLGKDGFTLARIHLAPIMFMIGPVPVVISHDILVVMKIDLAGKMQVTIDAKNQTSTALGFEYKNNKLDEVRTFTTNTTVEPKVVLSGVFTMTAEPKYSASFFGMKKVNSVELFTGIALETKLSQEIADIYDLMKYGLNPEITISRIINVGIRAKLKLLSKKIIDAELSFNLLKEVLIKGSVFPQFSDVEVTDFGVAAATADAPESSLLRFIYPVSQYGILLSEKSSPTIENGWYNNLGAMPASWTPATAPVASALLKDLPGVGEIDGDKTYYVCVYFRNTFGTFYSKVTKYPDKNDSDYVLINGVKWATRNVGAPGTFVKKPEDYGEHYQFNNGTRSFVGDSWNYINSVYGKSRSWLPGNDPSPAGWRVPTFNEFIKLFEANKVRCEWIKKSDFTGLKITDTATGNSIVLPAAGYYDPNRGLGEVGTRGYYWISESNDVVLAKCLDFGSDRIDFSLNWCIFGQSIRPVKNN